MTYEERIKKIEEELGEVVTFEPDLDGDYFVCDVKKLRSMQLATSCKEEGKLCFTDEKVLSFLQRYVHSPFLIEMDAYNGDNEDVSVLYFRYRVLELGSHYFDEHEAELIKNKILNNTFFVPHPDWTDILIDERTKSLQGQREMLTYHFEILVNEAGGSLFCSGSSDDEWIRFDSE